MSQQGVQCLYLRIENGRQAKCAFAMMRFLLLISIIYYCLTCCTCKIPYLAICVIARDEPDFELWLEYHKRIGVSKFYVFDNNSSVPLLNSIDRFLRDGLVEYTFFVGNKSSHFRLERPQFAAYDSCIRLHRHKHEFIAFIDADEFIVVKDKTRTIPEILESYSKFAAVTLHWMVFGSSGHIERPPGNMLDNYWRCFKSSSFKSIVNMKYVVGISNNPHEFLYKPGYIAVNMNKQPASMRNHISGGAVAVSPADVEDEQEKERGAVRDSLYDVMYINHYTVKSQADYQRKVQLGKADSQSYRSMEYLVEIDRKATDDCETLQMPPEA